MPSGSLNTMGCTVVTKVWPWNVKACSLKAAT